MHGGRSAAALLCAMHGVHCHITVTCTVSGDYAGGLLKECIIGLMEATGVPMGIGPPGIVHKFHRVLTSEGVL